MAEASYAIGNFLGGEISTFAQGRFDKPDYRTSLKTCRNSFPVESGAHVRRPGTRYAGTTLNGAPGRVIEFDVKQASAFTCEHTDANLRFRSGPNIVGATLATPYVGGNWANIRVVQAETVQILLNPTVAPQALINTSGTTFTLNPAVFNDGPYLDPLTNGAQLTPGSTSGIVTLTLAFPAFDIGIAYSKGAFVTSSSINYESLQDQNAGNTPVITGTTNGTTASGNATLHFASTPTHIIAGMVVTDTTAPTVIPAGTTVLSKTGTTVVMSANATGAGVGSGDTIVFTSPAWTPVSANAAINGGQGFLGTDIGRLVRLYSEPAAWTVGGIYSLGQIVSYNPSGLPNASTYWSSAVAGTNTNSGNVPGLDVSKWALVTTQGAAVWTWGKIVSLSNAISGGAGTNIGNMTSAGGLAAAFDGNPTKAATACALLSTSGGVIPVNTVLSLDTYVGKNYGGQQVLQVTVFPSSDDGFCAGSYINTFGGGSVTNPYVPTFVLNLRGKATAPASPSDGTLLGTSGSMANTAAAVSIASNDQVTSWNYVWVELVASFTNTAGPATTYGFTNVVAQVEFFSPPGSGGTSVGINVEILGPALLYTNVITTWRFGLYSITTGWPTCGVYDGGRIWLGGAVDNRVDACYSNGNVGGTLNFAPTDQYGQVTAANAISYTFNSRSVNPVLWMRPDLQGIKVGTQAGEWLIQAPTAGAISPLNIAARNVTSHGSENIEPADTEHTLVFVQRFGRKLLEYFPDVFSGKFSAPNLADKAAHFTRAGVAELAYTSAVTPIIWGRCTDGTWFGITYKRDSLASSQPPTFYGWHGHTLGSGRVVESICSGASVGGNLDALTMVTNDPNTNVRHVEILTDVQDELTPLAQSWFLDDAVIPTAALSATFAVLTGLPYPNGAVVQVFCAGLDCGDPGEGKPVADFTVTSGAIQIAYGDSISAGPGRGLFTQAAAQAAIAAGQLVVGYTYNSDAQLVRPMSQADSGARNGPAFAKLSRGHRYGLKLVNTAALLVGGSFAKLLPAALKKPNSPANIDAGTTFTGVAYGELLDDYDYEGGTPCWRVSRPFPANVVIVGTNLATQDQ